MSRSYPPLSEKSKYYLPQEKYYAAVSYAKQYPGWIAELEALPDTRKAIQPNGDRVQSSGDGDPTFETAAKRIEIEGKIIALENTLKMVCPEMTLYPFLLDSVTKGTSFNVLKAAGVPYERTQFYKIRRAFYYYYSKKI